MDRKAIKEHLEKVRISVENVLDRYITDKGCPCGIKQFVYWAGKHQGPGWQDNIQNQLVTSSLSLYCFEQIDDCENSYGLEGSYACTNCGTDWNHYLIEWRMLAFHHRLIKVGADDPGKLYDEIISEDVAATVGKEPAGRKALSLAQWVAFMLGREYRIEPYKAQFPVSQAKDGFWRKVLSCLKRKP